MISAKSPRGRGFPGGGGGGGAAAAPPTDAPAAATAAVDEAGFYRSDDSGATWTRIGKQARGYAHDGVDAARTAASDLRDRSYRAVDSTRGYVRDEPLKSLLIAAAVGAAVIALVEVVRVRRTR